MGKWIDRRDSTPGRNCPTLQKRGVRLHVDATHVLGKLYFELEEIGADYLTFNGDQLHAPKGTGMLYVKQGVPCSPFIYGSADQAGPEGRGPDIGGFSRSSLRCKRGPRLPGFTLHRNRQTPKPTRKRHFKKASPQRKFVSMSKNGYLIARLSCFRAWPMRPSFSP